jgi:sugar/nucleoside kinase (ribokinase family)
MKTVGLCALGNAIIDLLIEVDDQEFESLGLRRAGMQLVNVEDQAALLKKLHATRDDLVFKSGGSAANSVIAYAQLGGVGAFLGTVGDDDLGKEYKREMKHLGIQCSLPHVVGGRTGTSLILITPDAERTMNTCLGCAGDFSPDQLDLELIKSSEWLLLEGYLLANPNGGQAALSTSFEYAKKNGTKVAFTCSEQWVVENFYKEIASFFEGLDLLVANEAEAIALATSFRDKSKSATSEGEPMNVEEAFDLLRGLVPECLITRGKNGVLVAHNGHLELIEAFECDPIDLTGAGDAFIGTYLNAKQDGHSVRESARMGCFVASKVISQVGPRLDDPKSIMEGWASSQMASAQ